MKVNGYLHSIDIAAAQFKLSVHVAGATHGGYLPQKCIGMTYGGLTMGKDDLFLAEDEAQSASTALQHCAIFLLAVAVDTALEQVFSDRFAGEAKTEAIIARVLRNAFAHDPFFPRWQLSNRNHIGQFEIPNVMKVDTSNLDGQPVDWQDYGGPLALLRFARHCQQVIESASRFAETSTN
jgi:hypothetical protein